MASADRSWLAEQVAALADAVATLPAPQMRDLPDVFAEQGPPEVAQLPALEGGDGDLGQPDLASLPDIAPAMEQGGGVSLADSPGALPPPAVLADLPGTFPESPTPQGLGGLLPQPGPPAAPAWPQGEPQMGADGSVTYDSAAGGPEATAMPEAAAMGDGPTADIVGMLNQIAEGIASLSGQQRQPRRGMSVPAGPGQHAWSGGFGVPIEQEEGYATGSPSVNVTNLAGVRGAGGWGFGSRGLGTTPVDIYEPQRRMPLGGGGL